MASPVSTKNTVILPPEFLGLGRFIYKHNATASAGGGYFKDWPESWLELDGHYRLSFDSINVDGVSIPLFKLLRWTAE